MSIHLLCPCVKRTNTWKRTACPTTLPVVVIQIENHDDTNANLNKVCHLRFLKLNFYKKIYIGMTDSRALRTKFQMELWNMSYVATKPIDTTEQRLKLSKHLLTEAGNESNAGDNKPRWTSFRWNLKYVVMKPFNITESQLKLSKCRWTDVRTRFRCKFWCCSCFILVI